MSKSLISTNVPAVKPVERKPKTILAVYRRVSISHKIEIRAGGDVWMFLALSNAHYGICGYLLDAIFLMDGITQDEFINDSGYTAIYPSMTKDTIILEAG